jgi:predicted small secreted protein
MPARRTIILVLAAALLAAATSAPTALADPGNAADPTWEAAGGVYGIARGPNAVYLGGTFTQVKSPSGGSSVARTRLAAFDATTGVVVPGWAPSANDIVHALTVSPDGSRVYAGGDFSSVSGKTRGKLAAIDATTGEVLDAWRPTTNGRVSAIAVIGNTVYVAGSFSSVSGQSRQRIAAIDAATGQVINGWNPGANGTVRSLAVSPDGQRLYLGGKFTTVGTSSRMYLAAVDPGSGSVLAWKPSVSETVMSVAANRDRVVVGEDGPGGTCEAFDASNASGKWSVHADGNVQAVGIAGNLAYCGGHGALADGQTRKKIFAVNVTTGALSSWNPGMNSTVGVRVILGGYGQQVYIGGDFTQVFTESREGFAQFTDPSIVPPGAVLPFVDDFDGGLTGWSGVTNARGEDLAFASGPPSIRLEAAAGKAFAYRSLATPASTVCLRSDVAVVNRDASLVLLQLLAEDGTSIARAFVSATGELQARSDVSNAVISTGAQLPFGWSTVQLCATTGAGGGLSIYLDGALLGQTATNMGAAKIGRLQIGDGTALKSFDMLVDDLAAATAPLT